MRDLRIVMTGSGAFRASLVLGLTVAAMGAPALGQDVFNLPPGTASPSARPAGPVDPEAPSVAPRPSPSVTARPSPAASTTPSKAATQRPGSSRPAPRPVPPVTQKAATLPAAATPSRPEPTTPATDATALPTTAPTPAPPAPQPASATGPTGRSSDWLAFAAGALFGALVLLALVGRLIWRRRSTSASAPETFEPPVAAPAEPAGLRPPAEPRPEVAPEPTAVEQDAGLAITLEALRLDVSLVAATLSYQLTLSNRGGAALSALAIEGDLVAAHASLPVEQQIANTEQRLELRHALVELAPGGVAEFRGELRLPLTAITPIRAGNAAYFVPLARLRIEAAQSPDEPFLLAQTFVTGELPEQPGGALRPFRLDLGPRTFGRLGQRAVV